LNCVNHADSDFGKNHTKKAWGTNVIEKVRAVEGVVIDRSSLLG